eukprot:1279632-Amphidinium_carterae.1
MDGLLNLLRRSASGAPDLKARCHILRISMLSGRCTHVVIDRKVFETIAYGWVLFLCYLKLELDKDPLVHKDAYSLVHGNEVVQDEAKLQDWPGIRPRGEVSEYQLLVQQAQHS